MSTKVIQRSPDLGIGVRLKRISEVEAAVPGKISPPVWWGWFGTKKDPLTVLEVVHDTLSDPMYQPGLWVAYCAGATSVSWQVEYTPTIWFNGPESGDKEIIAWTGDPVLSSLPPAGTLPDDVFYPASVDLPEPLTVGEVDIAVADYWVGDVTGLPLVIAAGNSLSVMPYSGSPSGVLKATAFSGAKKLGVVQLTIKRVVSNGASA